MKQTRRRRKRYRFTKEDCQRGYQAALRLAGGMAGYKPGFSNLKMRILEDEGLRRRYVWTIRDLISTRWRSVVIATVACASSNPCAEAVIS